MCEDCIESHGAFAHNEGQFVHGAAWLHLSEDPGRRPIWQSGAGLLQLHEEELCGQDNRPEKCGLPLLRKVSVSREGHRQVFVPSQCHQDV